jgi:hypothetical protein
MYAVGWGGEIWWRDHGTWRRIDSPVSVNLNALCCAEDGHVPVPAACRGRPRFARYPGSVPARHRSRGHAWSEGCGPANRGVRR